MLTLSALTGPSGMGGGSKSAYPAERPEEHIGRSSPLKGFHWTVKDSFKLPISFKSIASSCFSDTKRSFVSHFLEFWLLLTWTRFKLNRSMVMERSLKGHGQVIEKSKSDIFLSKSYDNSFTNFSAFGNSNGNGLSNERFECCCSLRPYLFLENNWEFWIGDIKVKAHLVDIPFWQSVHWTSTFGPCHIGGQLHIYLQLWVLRNPKVRSCQQ